MSVTSVFRDAVKSAIASLQSIAEGLSAPDATLSGSAELITEQANNLTAALAVADESLVPPVITSISPTSGQVGTIITILGSGFGNAPNGSVVRIGAEPAHPNSWSDSELVITVPTSLAANGDVSVTTSAGKSAGSFQFTLA